MITATLVKDVSDSYNGVATLWKLSEPKTLPTYLGEKVVVEYFIVSSIASAPDHGRPETMIFRANKNGEVESYADLYFQYHTDQEAVLEGFLNKRVNALEG